MKKEVMTACSYVVFEMVANPHKSWDLGGEASWKFPDPLPSASGSWNLITDGPFFVDLYKRANTKKESCVTTILKELFVEIELSVV